MLRQSCDSAVSVVTGSVNTVTRLRAALLENRGSFSYQDKAFNPQFIQTDSGSPGFEITYNRRRFSRANVGQGMKVNTYHHLLLSLRMRGAVLPLPYTLSWRCA